VLDYRRPRVKDAEIQLLIEILKETEETTETVLVMSEHQKKHGENLTAERLQELDEIILDCRRRKTAVHALTRRFEKLINGKRGRLRLHEKLACHVLTHKTSP
jgi:hypothetical protein